MFFSEFKFGLKISKLSHPQLIEAFISTDILIRHVGISPPLGHGCGSWNEKEGGCELGKGIVEDLRGASRALTARQVRKLD